MKILLCEEYELVVLLLTYHSESFITKLHEQRCLLDIIVPIKPDSSGEYLFGLDLIDVD